MNASAQNSKQLKAGNANQNIQVYVRLRPMNSRERGIRSQEVVEVPNHKEVIARVLLDAKTQKKFSFDRAFGPDSKQHEVYATVVAPLIDEVLSGYNCTVFAYGQTGTGKTHTMVGEESPELSLSWEDDSVIGIIPRALSHLFDELRMTECEFSMRVSYLELYNEELCDLLSTDDTVKIRIFDDSTKKGSVIVQGLEEIPVHSKDDVYKLLAKGQERRRTASTLMNAQSSRSHTVFSILVHIKEVDINGEEMLKIGKLNLVDLAGSENISKAGNERGIRVRETVNINQSLLTLGRVITALVERTPHIPYRESKLTRLLQESLGGRTKTSIIATISPGHKDLEETLSTLDYAHRAKNIQNKPEINQRLTKKAVLKEYTEEIDKLKRDLMAARDKNGIFLAQESYDDMMYKIETSNKELNDKHLMIKALKDELASKTKLFNEVSYNLIERTKELQNTEVKLANTETDLHHTKKTLSKTKRRYNEKKVILSQHMKTEETLTQQARDLIETCELASADTEGLHDTIERRKQVESEITSSCDKFTQKLQENLSTMNASLADFSEKYCKQSKFIQSEIDTASKTHGSLSKDLGQQLEAINKAISDGFSDRQTLLTFNLKQIDDKTTFNKKEILALVHEIQEKHEKHLHEVTSLTQKCSQNFEKQQKAWEAKQNDFLKVIHEKDVLVNNFTESLKSAMTTFMRESREKFDAEYKKTTEVVAKQEKELETLQSTFGQFVATMNTMLSQAKTNVADFKTGAAHLEENRKLVDAKMQSWTNDLTSHGTAYQTFIAKETKFNEELSQQATEVHETNKNSLDKMQNCTAEHVSDAKCSLTTLDKKVSTAFEDISALWHSQTREITELDTKVSKNTDEKLTSSKDLVQKCNNCVTAVTANSASLMNCLRKGIQTHESETKTKLLRVSDDAEHFRRNEIKSYQPTGQTPARKEYRIVRDLAVTSPHHRIIRKFMLDNTASDLDSSIVSEADETLNDSSVIIMESTPMKLDDNVTERKDLKELHLSEILSLDAITEENKENQTIVN
ncbi:kinesin-like protein Klp61F [Culicoides brevitarsis]|uniref:kinesin-like protein Klp61F n=1 Tax=Culicoides brevitarsis TaxID=469753 RepID=UPI00307BA5CD